MKRQNRVFYVGMITPDSYGQAVGESTYAGAGERKMISVVHAMRHVGLRALIVSLPFVGTMKNRAYYGPTITTGEGVPAVFVATLRSKYLRKIFGPVFLAGFLWRNVRSGDTVILYNHAVEYFSSLVLLRLRGIHIVQDIEDVPTPEDRGVRGVLNHLGFALTSRLTRPRKMVVSDHVARGLGLDDYVVIRGVAAIDQDIPPAAQDKWAALHSGAALTVHFGGTLRPDTGVDLFCAAVEILAREADMLARPLIFKVTGIGAFDKIRALGSRIGTSGRVRLDVQEGLNKRDYDALIDSCHAALSLRQPEAHISNTTFPSKVIEITARGVALISSDQGDVTTLFDDHSAFPLGRYESTELAGIIAGMAADPEQVERVAAAGRDLCNEVFAPTAVGEMMKRLL